MSDTIIEQLTKEIVDDLLIKSPEFAPVIFGCLKNLRSGYYKPTELVNAIFQKYEKIDVDVYDAYCFLHVWAGIFTGEILTANVAVFDTPHKNIEINKNNEILSKLRHPFKAEFIPSQSGDDGFFEWLEDLDLKQEIVEDEKSEINYLKVCPTKLPLEVGYTSAQKTYEYLFMTTGGLARYPYHSKDIVILYNVNFEKDFCNKISKMY